MKDSKIKSLGENEINPELHKIVTMKFEKRCIICDRSIYQRESGIYNFVKKTNKHLNCSLESVMKRPRWVLTSRSETSHRLYASGADRPRDKDRVKRKIERIIKEEDLIQNRHIQGTRV